MKATTIIIAAALALQVNLLFAENNTASSPLSAPGYTISISTLAPVTPKEADFEETIEMIDYSSLAPVIAAEAQPEDLTVELLTSLNLAPLAPAAADVDDEIDFTSLAPVNPSEAYFE